MTAGPMAGGVAVFADDFLAADVVNEEMTLKTAIRKLLFYT